MTDSPFVNNNPKDPKSKDPKSRDSKSKDSKSKDPKFVESVDPKSKDFQERKRNQNLPEPISNSGNVMYDRVSHIRNLTYFTPSKTKRKKEMKIKK